MFSILRQPNAVLAPAPVQIRGAAVIGLFIGLFLLVFQPFGLSQWETEQKWFKIIGFGLITFAFTSLHFTLWPALFPRFFAERNWTVGRSIAYILLNILTIALGNFLYLGFLLDLPFRWGNMLWMVLVTLAVGIFPTTGVVLWGYIRRLRRYQNTAATLHPVHQPTTDVPARENPRQHKLTATADSPLISLIADNERDTLSLAPADLLFIESSDNYCTVYYLLNGKLQKPLLRSSLSRIETQLANFPRLVRCHRSFIVNLDKVERVTGNAQGYKLHLPDGNLEVPVARRYNETLVASLRAV